MEKKTSGSSCGNHLGIHFQVFCPADIITHVPVSHSWCANLEGSLVCSYEWGIFLKSPDSFYLSCLEILTDYVLSWVEGLRFIGVPAPIDTYRTNAVWVKFGTSVYKLILHTTCPLHAVTVGHAPVTIHGGVCFSFMKSHFVCSPLLHYHWEQHCFFKPQSLDV